MIRLNEVVRRISLVLRGSDGGVSTRNQTMHSGFPGSEHTLFIFRNFLQLFQSWAGDTN
jgi:hypothetical protein